MVEGLKKKIARWLTKDYVVSLEAEHAKRLLAVDMDVNVRVAKIISEMDVFEPLMKKYHGVFSEDLEHPEERLDYPSRLQLYMWGWQQKTDPSFMFITNWIMNTQGNETLKHAPVTTDRILYGRAQLSTMLLFRNEVERLSNLYQEDKLRREGVTYDVTVAVED